MDGLLAMQRIIIASELSQLKAARTQLPTPERREWMGIAREAYAACIARLHIDLATAIDRLQFALDETDRAMTTLGTR